jgi:DNA-directed RNA polymerase specialized sigma24 family protein
MNDNQVKIISKKIDLLIRLSALSLVMGKTQSEQIVLLNKAGFQPKEIADILGTTANTVRVSLSKTRRELK